MQHGREKQEIYRKTPNEEELRAGKKFSIRGGWVSSVLDLQCPET